MAENCLFCDKAEKNCKPPPNTEYVCGMCVQMILNADREELRRICHQAIEQGDTRKAEGIRLVCRDKFSAGRIEKNESRPQPEQHRLDPNRGRASKAIGNFKERIGWVSI
ncbi:MAG: hypothetical protein C4530_14530 [Desulfobacteraceae bacterium]|nr:MAG: hypothetical protein C4530_14530 [Desulfobacteraceae bacterium]